MNISIKKKELARCRLTISITGFIFFSLAACQSDPPDVATDEQSPTPSVSSPFALPPEAEKSPDSPAQDTVSSVVPPQSPLHPTPTEKTSAISDLTATELQEKGTALAREGNFKDARILLAYSLRKEPENLVTLNNLGLVMRKLGKLDDALKTYQFALQVNKEYALTHKNLGILLEKIGDKELAVQAYRKYCLLAPKAEDVKKVSARADWLEGIK